MEILKFFLGIAISLMNLENVFFNNHAISPLINFQMRSSILLSKYHPSGELIFCYLNFFFDCRYLTYTILSSYCFASIVH